MDNEQLKIFKEKVYDPYLEAWSIIAKLREMDLSVDGNWEKWFKLCNEFYAKYHDDSNIPSAVREYCLSLYRVMLDAGDCAKRVWDGEM